MAIITVKNYLNAKVHTITIKNKDYFRVKMTDVQDGLGIKNISDLVRKEIFGKNYDKEQSIKDLKEQIREFKRSETELDKKNVYASNITKYGRSDIMEKIIKKCRGVKRCNDGINRMEKTNQRNNFRMLLGFQENDIFQTKEQSALSKIQTVFSTGKIILQHSVLGYYINLCFLEHRLAIEINEQDHQNRDINQEVERQKAIEKELNCKFIRSNQDKENFNVIVEVSKIQNHIIESTKKLTKKTVMLFRVMMFRVNC